MFSFEIFAEKFDTVLAISVLLVNSLLFKAGRFGKLLILGNKDMHGAQPKKGKKVQ